MEQVVQFRSTIGTFDDGEFKSFRNKLFAAYNERSLLIKCLTFMMMDQSKHANYSDIGQINAICKEITDLRRKNKEIKSKTEEKESDNNHFNKLPSALISNTASYLETNEQPQFMYCNRYIFISCAAAPSTIPELDGDDGYSRNWMEKYLNTHGHQFSQFQTLKLNRFRGVESVAIANNGAAFTEPPIFGVNGSLWPWKKLSLLRLNGFDLFRDDERCNYAANILQQISIEKLLISLILWDADNNDRVLRVLTANQGLKCLIFKSILGSQNAQAQISFDELKNKWPKLFGLGFSNCPSDFIHGMLTAFGPQLKALYVGQNNRQALDLSDIKFEELTELVVLGSDQSHFCDILASAQKLERLRWRIGGNDWTNERIKNVIGVMSKQMHMLRAIYIEKSEFDSELLECFIKEFGEVSNVRKNMKVCIEFKDALNEDQLVYVNENIEKIVVATKKSAECDFLFGLKIRMRDNRSFKNMKKTLTQMYIKSDYLIHTFGYVPKFQPLTKSKHIWIRNKQNKMCGYNESWIMDAKIVFSKRPKSYQ